MRPITNIVTSPNFIHTSASKPYKGAQFEKESAYINADCVYSIKKDLNNGGSIITTKGGTLYRTNFTPDKIIDDLQGHSNNGFNRLG